MKPVAMLVLAFAGLSVPAALAHPGSGLVVDAKGNVYFLPHYSERHSWMIYRVDPAGEVTVLVDDERLEERHDLFLDAEGQLVTATRGRVWRISPRGELSQIHPPASWTDFRPPQDDWTDPLVVARGGDPFAFDPRGNLYCARIGYGEPRKRSFTSMSDPTPSPRGTPNPPNYANRTGG